MGMTRNLVIIGLLGIVAAEGECRRLVLDEFLQLNPSYQMGHTNIPVYNHYWSQEKLTEAQELFTPKICGETTKESCEAKRTIPSVFIRGEYQLCKWQQLSRQGLDVPRDEKPNAVMSALAAASSTANTKVEHKIESLMKIVLEQEEKRKLEEQTRRKKWLETHGECNKQDDDWFDPITLESLSEAKQVVKIDKFCFDVAALQRNFEERKGCVSVKDHSESACQRVHQVSNFLNLRNIRCNPETDKCFINKRIYDVHKHPYGFWLKNKMVLRNASWGDVFKTYKEEPLSKKEKFHHWNNDKRKWVFARQEQKPDIRVLIEVGSKAEEKRIDMEMDWTRKREAKKKEKERLAYEKFMQSLEPPEIVPLPFVPFQFPLSGASTVSTNPMHMEGQRSTGTTNSAQSPLERQNSVLSPIATNHQPVTNTRSFVEPLSPVMRAFVVQPSTFSTNSVHMEGQQSTGTSDLAQGQSERQNSGLPLIARNRELRLTDPLFWSGGNSQSEELEDRS